jgi:hypothetical protein
MSRKVKKERQVDRRVKACVFIIITKAKNSFWLLFILSPPAIYSFSLTVAAYDYFLLPKNTRVYVGKWDDDDDDIGRSREAHKRDYNKRIKLKWTNNWTKRYLTCESLDFGVCFMIWFRDVQAESIASKWCFFMTIFIIWGAIWRCYKLFCDFMTHSSIFQIIILFFRIWVQKNQ